MEGPTDFAVLSKVVEAFTSKPMLSILFQPEASDAFASFGQTGTGWKGVRSWCEQLRIPLQDYLESGAGPAVDLLIFHLDADVSRDSEVNQALPCPPARHRANRLRGVLRSWFTVPSECSKSVICIPSDALETWVGAAFGTPIDECRSDPALLLTPSPYNLLRTKDGKPKKRVFDYREFAQTVVDNWETVTSSCLMASLFERACRLRLNPDS